VIGLCHGGMLQLLRNGGVRRGLAGLSRWLGSSASGRLEARFRHQADLEQLESADGIRPLPGLSGVNCLPVPQGGFIPCHVSGRGTLSLGVDSSVRFLGKAPLQFP
jgi:hypothetical protein